MNKIICGNCLDILPTIETNSVELVFTDPPYNRKKPYDNYHDNLPEAEYQKFIKTFLGECKRISNNRLAIFIGSKLIKQYWDLIPDAKLIIVRKGAIGTPFKDYYYQYFALLVNVLPRFQIYDLWTDIRMPGEGYYYREERYPNPGQTALGLVERVIDYYSNEGDVIFDPFMGCGTTAVAAKKLNRRYIGCEISPKYCAIAENRLMETDAVQLPIAQTVTQLRLEL